MQHSLSNKNNLPHNQMELDEAYERYIGSEVEGLLESDETYQYQSTPLKTAEAIKDEQRQAIKEELKQSELREHIRKAYDLIIQRLPQLVSPEEFDQLTQEFAKSAEHFDAISQKPESVDQPPSLQDSYGISDVSMMLIYSLGYACLKNQEFNNAESIFYFLTLLNPSVSIFWISLGTALEHQGKPESKFMFETAQILDPTNPNAFILGAESDIRFNHKENVEEQLKNAEKIIQNSKSINNKQELIDKINYLRRI